MESKLPHTHGHDYESKDLSAANPSGLHSGVEGEGHHEKQSVLKKVKAKAKKMKHTLTKPKHGHDHDHDHDHEYDHNHKPAEYDDDDDDDDDDDVDEEMVEDPEIHGAPIYESAAVNSANRTSGDQPGTGLGTNLDKPIDPAGKGSGEAEGIAPVIQSFNKMGIAEEKPKTEQGDKLYTGSHDQFAPEPIRSQSSESVPKSYNAAYHEDEPSNTFNPSSQSGAYRDLLSPPSQGSTYTEKITSASAAAASAIAGTAQSAKSVISSKIEQMRDQGEGTNSGSVTGTASDYAHRIAATVTDTLAPVYGKVVGVSNVASTNVSGQESGALEQDKGVSVKEYWAEKLKPGEEDRALSAIITDSFTKPKEEKTHVGSEAFTEHKEKTADHASGDGGGRGISEIVSDAVHQRQPEEGEKERPMGKVTESEEVAKRLGTGEEGTGVENLGTGGGVVDKLKNVVGSWIGGQGGQTQSAPGTSVAADDEGDVGKDTAAQGVAGERRLHGSSN